MKFTSTTQTTTIEQIKYLLENNDSDSILIYMNHFTFGNIAQKLLKEFGTFACAIVTKSSLSSKTILDDKTLGHGQMYEELIIKKNNFISGEKPSIIWMQTKFSSIIEYIKL